MTARPGDRILAWAFALWTLAVSAAFLADSAGHFVGKLHEFGLW